MCGLMIGAQVKAGRRCRFHSLTPSRQPERKPDARRATVQLDAARCEVFAKMAEHHFADRGSISARANPPPTSRVTSSVVGPSPPVTNKNFGARK